MLPGHSPFYLTDIIADFIKSRFWWHVLHAPIRPDDLPPAQTIPRLFPSSHPGPIPPLALSAELVADAELMAAITAQAYTNRIHIDMDAARYDQALPKRPLGKDPEQEEKTAARYLKPPHLTDPVRSPACLVDRYGKFLVWHLPSVLSPSRQNKIWQALVQMDDALRGSLSKDSSSWRNNPKFYKSPETCVPLPGNVNLSPAWFQQGHDGERFDPEISSTLKPGNIKPCTQRWLEDMTESFALMGALMMIIHPDLYAAGRQVYHNLIENPQVLKDGDAVLEILRYWTSPFSGYGIISNCTTPIHRDNFSQGAWFDLLTTVGQYSGSTLVLGNLGMKLSYEPGTMVALLGRLIRHGITETDGSRVCIAQYMRDNMVERSGIQAPEWMTVAKMGEV